MRRLVLAACVAVACGVPATTLARPSEDFATPTSVPTPALTATAVPSAALSPEPTLEPAAAPTQAPVPIPPPSGPVHNEGQWIVVWAEAGIGFHIGEAPVAGTSLTYYRLNGAPFGEGSTLRCVDLRNETCFDLRILPATPLVFGRRYELTLQDAPLGAFTAVGPGAVATPHALSAKATQFELTITFDRPMLHVGECGDRSRSLIAPHTLGFVRTSGAGFPFAPGAYTSSSDAYRDFLANFVSEAVLGDDCRSVTLRSGWGGPTGAFDLTVSGITDEYGTPMAERTFAVDIANEGAPKLMSLAIEHLTPDEKVIRVMYSEAMDEEYVTDRDRYYVNGKPIPAGTSVECETPACTWVRLALAPSLFHLGSVTNTMTIVGVRDWDGNTMDPDVVTTDAFGVY